MKLVPNQTAILTLDFNHGIVDLVPEPSSVVDPAARLADFARTHGFLLMHVGLGFREGHPEISPSNARFSAVKENNLFVIGSPSAAIVEPVFQSGDIVVHKHRFSAFSENELHLILQSQGIQHLVLFGITTSGIVLSTLRRAFDLDYRCTVISDACVDRDPEVHRVLLEKVFPAQAEVLTSEAFLAAQR